MGVGVNNGVTNLPASLYSPTIPQSGAMCQVKFWLRFVGSYGSLNVSMNLNEEKTVLLYRKDNIPQVLTWSQVVIDLGLFILFLN